MLEISISTITWINNNWLEQLLLLNSFEGNEIYCFTITEENELIDFKDKPAIILFARVHPGESNSS